MTNIKYVFLEREHQLEVKPAGKSTHLTETLRHLSQFPIGAKIFAYATSLFLLRALNFDSISRKVKCLRRFVNSIQRIFLSPRSFVSIRCILHQSSRLFLRVMN